MGHTFFGEDVEKLSSAGERPHLRRHTLVGFHMKTLQTLGFCAAEIAAGLSQQSVYEKPTAHPDPAMNAPYREFHPRVLQRLTPCEHVLVNTVDECAVEIEEEGRRGGCGQAYHLPADGPPAIFPTVFVIYTVIRCRWRMFN